MHKVHVGWPSLGAAQTWPGNFLAVTCQSRTLIETVCGNPAHFSSPCAGDPKKPAHFFTPLNNPDVHTHTYWMQVGGLDESDSDDEDKEIKPTDLVILATRNEDDVSNLEVNSLRHSLS